MEKIYKALANRRRLAIIRYLHKNDGVTVGDISEEINLSFTATSKHLQVLKAVSIIRNNQINTEQHYYLIDRNNKFIKDLLASI